MTELRVRDLAVIADVTVSLGPGLNVMTGETGAGKSILVDALALLLGERASGDLVRPGAKRATVEAAFDVGGSAAFLEAADEAGVEVEDGRFVAKREINREGRNRAWANGSPTTVGVLSQLGQLLVDLHGQHESQSLLRPGTQRDLLDDYAGAGPEREEAATHHRRLLDLRRREQDLLDQRDDVLKRADYLRHVVREIEEADPRPGEDDELSAEVRRLANAEELTTLCERLVGALDDDEQSVTAVLGDVERTIVQLQRLDGEVASWRPLLDEILADTQELVRDIRSYAGRVEIDPERLAEVEARRDTIFSLMRKYGATIEAVVQTARESREALDVLDTADLDLAGITDQRRVAEEALGAAARELTRKRKAAARRLADEVTAMLPALGMPQGRLVPVVAGLPEAGPAGQDTVTFDVQLNPGMDPRPLAQVASGGELSRLMLALKVVLANQDAVPTLIFDEVDQGIGGEVGAEVGEALAAAARTRQVLVITHLPQIAARAGRQLSVSKDLRGKVASTAVRILDADDRVREIARMLGDPDDTALLQHARELLRTRAPGGSEVTLA